jgi:hypothetical protein
MEISKKQYYILFFAIISFILLVAIFKWVDYLTQNNYIVENFAQGIRELYNGSTSHSVDLPLTTTYSCRNFCSPTSRCAITGQQCFADIDCPGCQPYSPPLPKDKDGIVPGDNDAGKLTFGVTPQYSPLTSGYGTFQATFTDNPFSKPDMPNFGVNSWIAGFNDDMELFNRRYKPPQLKYMPDYAKRYSLSGQFIDDGPFASNAMLPPVNFYQ